MEPRQEITEGRKVAPSGCTAPSQLFAAFSKMNCSVLSVASCKNHFLSPAVVSCTI
jgi:hypothetical protein